VEYRLSDGRQWVDGGQAGPEVMES
jgi:hypothetical protein